MNTSYPSSVVVAAASRLRGRVAAAFKGRFGNMVRLALALALLATGAATPSARALCAAPTYDGNWRNTDSATRGITRAVVRFECGSRVTCSGSICSIQYDSDPRYYIRLFGSCYPSDCDWGEVRLTPLGANTGWSYAYYNQGFARRWVYVYTAYPGWLYVSVDTDFVDPSRADYTSSGWYRR